MNEPRLTVQTDRVQLKDSSGEEVGNSDNPLNVEGNFEGSILDRLDDLICELKIANRHLSEITGSKIGKEDLE